VAGLDLDGFTHHIMDLIAVRDQELLAKEKEL
jgi:hypothetical protein